MGMAYGQRKQRTEDWNKETSVGKEIPGKKIFGYIVGENGDLIYDGPCTITCTLPYTKVYEPSGLLRYGSRLYDDYEHKGEYKWQGNYKKGLLDGAISIEDEYSIAGEWADHFEAFRFIDYTTISYSFALSGKFTSGVPNGSFSVVQDGEEVLDATYKDGALVGYFYCYEHHGNISDGGKLTGEWVVDRYVEMEFLEGVLLSKTTSQRSTRPADVELARKYAKGEITKQELWDKHFIVVRTASIDLGSCARAIIMSETYDLPHFNDKENIFYYEYLDCVVEDSVIRAETFKGDKELTSIVVPEGVTEIGERVFQYCSGLTNISIPNSVTTIGNYAFANCSSLTSITIPDGVTTIGMGAFDGCSNLTSITIPNSVTEIGHKAFSGCSSLTSITIPDSVMDIGYEAFNGCKGDLIINCNIPDGNIDYYPLGGSQFTKVTIGNSVTSIGHCAFCNCSSLTNITIGNSVTKIGIGAFYNCSNLTCITIPNSVTEIGHEAFSGCSSLTCITIPNSVMEIGYCAFNGCKGELVVNCNIGNNYPLGGSQFTKITIGNGVTDIGDYAFKDCSNITCITIPNSVTEIGYEAFSGCSSLTSITIPNSVMKIGYEAFKGCKGELVINCNMPDGELRKYNSNPGQYCWFYEEPMNFYGGNSTLKGSQFTNIIIGEGVNKIGDYSFAGCSSLKEVTLPKSLTDVGNGIFLGTRYNFTIHVPKEVVKILKQDYHFYMYKSLIKKIK